MATIAIDHRVIRKYLLWAVASFALVNLVLIGLAALGHRQNSAHGLMWRLLYLDREQNIPTYFSSFILLVAAVLAAAAGRVEPNGQKVSIMWLVLALSLLAVSMDEFISLHEFYGSKVGLVMMGEVESAQNFAWNHSTRIGGLEVLHVFAWVVPAVFALLIATPFVIAFLRALPPQIRWLVLASGVTFVGGAVGFEMVNALIETQVGNEHPWYSLGIVVEESLEMTGVTLFIVAMLRHLSTRMPSVRIDFS